MRKAGQLSPWHPQHLGDATCSWATHQSTECQPLKQPPTHLHQALVLCPQPPRVRLLGALNLALQRLDVAAGGVQRLLPQVDCGGAG